MVSDKFDEFVKGRTEGVRDVRKKDAINTFNPENGAAQEPIQ
jgi:hypothetical protein